VTVEAPQQDHSHTKTSSANVKLSPAARYIVDSQTLDVSSLTGTSKHGIISKEDIVVAMKSGKIAASSPVAKSAVSSNSTPSSSQSLPPSSSPIAPTSSSHATPPPPSPPPSPHTNTNTVKMIPSQNQDKFVDIPNTNMRKVIAKRLSESKSNVPHLYATIECEIDDILALRSLYKKELGVNISVNDIVIKSVAMALRDVPQANSKWNAKTSSIDASRTIDISVAVATPSGLITPIVNNADQLGVNSINAKVRYCILDAIYHIII
jgi:pyruvate dehydrogenase E2 component (dihydrolipoamide acetyltransferase)